MDIPDPIEIVSKSVEISKSLVNTDIGLHTLDLEITRYIGDLARFSITLRNAISITEKQLDAISISMKILPRLVKSDMLVYLEKVGMVEVIKDGTKIERVKVNIPPVEDLIDIFSTKWLDDQPSILDIASIKALSLLSKSQHE